MTSHGLRVTLILLTNLFDDLERDIWNVAHLAIELDQFTATGINGINRRTFGRVKQNRHRLLKIIPRHVPKGIAVVLKALEINTVMLNSSSLLIFMQNKTLNLLKGWWRWRHKSF